MEYNEIKMKCAIGIFLDAEQTCRWVKPMPPERTVDDCKQHEQVMPSHTDPYVT